MKQVTFPLSVSGIERLRRSVEEYQRWLKDRSEKLLDRLGEEGYQIASAKFAQAVYDGTNDVFVSTENRGANIRAVVAVGSSVLFIEFGAGVVYPDDHPEADDLGMKRGEYGKGHGKQTSWGYYGEPGTNGELREKKNGSVVVITHGNPANMAMYETVKELEMHLRDLAKEVFV